MLAFRLYVIFRRSKLPEIELNLKYGLFVLNVDNTSTVDKLLVVIFQIVILAFS
jgi:hypothetical protein